MFHFDFDKAVQAAGCLLQAETPPKMEYMRLLKLLYIADRESLRETGVPVTGDVVYAMKQGPVLSKVYDLIKGEHLRSRDWDRFIKRSGYQVELVDQPGNGRLCRYEIEKLNEISERYFFKDTFEISEETHAFQEWQRNSVTQGQKEIPLTDILEAVGRAEDAESVAREADTSASFARAFRMH